MRTGHPIDLQVLVEPEYLRAAAEVSGQLEAGRAHPQALHARTPARSTPPCTTPSARSTASTATTPTARSSCTHDLGHYLGAEFAGEQLDHYVLREPKPTMPLYHLVGRSIRSTPRT